MALTFDAVSDNNGYVNVASVTWSHTCSASGNRGLAVMDGGWHPSGRVVSGITYAAVAMTGRANSGASAGDDFAVIYTLIAPATGANNIVVSITSGASGCAGGSTAASFTEVDQTTMHADATTATGNSGTATVTVPNNTAADAIVDCCAMGSGADPAMTARTNRTEIDTQADGGEGWGGSYLIPAPSGSQVMGYTGTSGNWASAGLRILGIAAVGQPTWKRFGGIHGSAGRSQRFRGGVW